MTRVPIWFLTNSTGKPHQEIYGKNSDSRDEQVFFDLRPDQRKRSLGDMELAEGQLCIVGAHDHDFNRKEYLKRNHRKKFEWWMLRTEEGPVVPSEKKKRYRKYFTYKERDSFNEPHLFYRGLKLWEDHVENAEPYSASSPYSPLLKAAEGAAKNVFILQQDMYPYQWVDVPESLIASALADFRFLSIDPETGLIVFGTPLGESTSSLEAQSDSERAKNPAVSQNGLLQSTQGSEEADLVELSDWIVEHREMVEKTLFSPQRDPHFRARVFASHGARCAVCSVQAVELLQAAHIRGVADGGLDHAGNGIPLCANHHLALDAGLWAVEPDTLDVVCRDGLEPGDIGIEVSRINLDLSHEDLMHRYEQFIALI